MVRQVVDKEVENPAKEVSLPRLLNKPVGNPGMIYCAFCGFGPTVWGQTHYYHMGRDKSLNVENEFVEVRWKNTVIIDGERKEEEFTRLDLKPIPHGFEPECYNCFELRSKSSLLK